VKDQDVDEAHGKSDYQTNTAAVGIKMVLEIRFQSHYNVTIIHYNT